MVDQGDHAQADQQDHPDDNSHESVPEPRRHYRPDHCQDNHRSAEAEGEPLQAVAPLGALLCSDALGGQSPIRERAPPSRRDRSARIGRLLIRPSAWV